jgi:hypothetical protein
MFDDDVISGAANAMLFERARVLVPVDDRDHDLKRRAGVRRRSTATGVAREFHRQR